MRTADAILGLVLAGGRSTRMGEDKAFVSLEGRPLIAHVLDNLHRQVDALAISANGDASRDAAFGAPVLADALGDRDAGPLAGIVAGLAYAEREGWPLVATAPCDAPFAPPNYVSRLTEALAASSVPAALVESPSGLEPLFALWRVVALPSLRAYLAEGGRSPRAVLTSLGAVRVHFGLADDAEAFANLNGPAELEQARAKSERR